MTSSPTPAELLAMKTANAALLVSPNASCDIVATVVFALGSAQLLQSPETAAEVERLRARVAELEAQRASLAVRLRSGQRWQQDRTPPLVSQDYVGQDELRAIFGIALTAPWDEDPCRPCGSVEALHASSGAVIETPSRREQSSAKLCGLLARQRAAVEDPHDDPVGLHHDYRTGRDLPEVTQ